jgi:hypothetical protein
MLSLVCLLIAAIAFLAELLARRFGGAPAVAPGPYYYSFWQPLGLLFLTLAFLLPKMFSTP